MAETMVEPEVEFFRMQAPYLTEGRQDTWLAEGSLLSLRLKVYAAGGENRVHRHPNEEHAFVVFEGEAEFYIGRDENLTRVGPYEGVYIPKGVFYRFISSGEGNLVMLRTGAADDDPYVAEYTDGTMKSAAGEPMGGMDGTPAPGRQFGEPTS